MSTTTISRVQAGPDGYLTGRAPTVKDARFAAGLAAQDTWRVLSGGQEPPSWVGTQVAQGVTKHLVAIEQTGTPVSRDDVVAAVIAARAVYLLAEAHAQHRPQGVPPRITAAAVGEAVWLLCQDPTDVPGMVAAMERCGRQGNRNVESVHNAVVRERAAQAAPRGQAQPAGTLAAGLSVLEARRARRAQNETNRSTQ